VKEQFESTPFPTKVHQPSYNFTLASQQMFINLKFVFIYLKFKDFLQDYADHCNHYHEADHASLHSFAPLQCFGLRSFTPKTAIFHSQ
jgi:hypothetical protein